MTGSDDPRSSGVRLIIVEDDPLIASVVRDMALRLGHEVAGIASGSTHWLMTNTRCDVAVLDVRLGREANFNSAEDAVTRGCGIVFATGFPEDIPGHLQKWPILIKPFSEKELGEAIGRALATRQGSRA